jgi:hypothetical protein
MFARTPACPIQRRQFPDIEWIEVDLLRTPSQSPVETALPTGLILAVVAINEIEIEHGNSRIPDEVTRLFQFSGGLGSTECDEILGNEALGAKTDPVDAEVAQEGQFFGGDRAR